MNASLTLRPPMLALNPDLVRYLPLPDGNLCVPPGAGCPQQIVDLADQIERRQFPIFGATIDAAPDIRWRRDYLRGIETGLRYFRLIPYLDAARAGDHKVIWELNRHQHLIVLAQAYLATADPRYLNEVRAQIQSWIAANPFHRGINWTSALEVAFRALSWIWVYQLAGSKLPREFRVRWLHALYLHGCHLANNLSFYFSPNNHLVGEALALHALGLFFGGAPRAAHWEALGAGVMEEQMERQIRADGSSFEQSTYYQVYLYDMFRLHATWVRPSPEYLSRLERMADFLNAIAGPPAPAGGEPTIGLPLLGDDDGGALPGGRSIQFRSDQPRSCFFPDAGLAVMACGDAHAVIDAGPFGGLNAGHSHSDTLSIVLRLGGDEILIDPGTYTYTGDPEWRNWFRSSAAHNTIRIDGRDQGIMDGPFRWKTKPGVKLLMWKTNDEFDVLEAECRYDGFTHRRRVEFQKPHVFLIHDSVDGPPGEHDVEQFWHLGSVGARSKLIPPAGAVLEQSWRSTTFGSKHPAPMLRVHRRCGLPLRLETRIDLKT